MNEKHQFNFQLQLRQANFWSSAAQTFERSRNSKVERCSIKMRRFEFLIFTLGKKRDGNIEGERERWKFN
jgi:hypothetical protein